MSWLSSGLKKLKPLGKVVNKVTDIGSYAAGLIPGPVGGILAGGIDTLGDLAGGKNLGQALKSGVKTGALSFVGGKALRGLLKAGGASPIAGAGAKVIGIGPGGIPMIDQGAAAAAGGGGWMSKLGAIGKGAAGLLGGKNPDGSTNWGGLLAGLGKVALPAVGAYQASKTQGKANDYRDKAIRAVEAEYAAGAPLRSLGLAGMTDLTPASTAGLFNQPRQQFRRITA